MVAAEEVEAVGELIFGGVGEGVVGAAGDDSREQEVCEVAVPGDLAEADDDADAGECADLGREVDGAVANLLGRGLVPGRRAADNRGDPRVAQAQAVVAGDGAGLGGEAEFVEHGVHEVAGAVSGKGAAGAVGSVSAGGEAEDEQAGAGVTEAGDRARPILVVLVGAAAGLADASAVVAEAGTELAGDDRVADVVGIGGGIRKLTQGFGRLGLRGARRAGSFATSRFQRMGMAEKWERPGRRRIDRIHLSAEKAGANWKIHESAGCI